MSLHQKKKPHNEEQGVDDWLMTYADMITLLLCFFAIFLSVSTPKKDAFSQMRSTVREKFASDDPAGQLSPAIAPGIKKAVQGSPFVASTMPHGIATEAPPLPGFNSVVGGMHEITNEVRHRPSREIEEEETENGKGKAKDGDRFSSIDMNSASFFAVGLATLSDEGKKILDGVLQTVRSSQYVKHTITIEGHTDDSPINTLQFPSNWELSTARASAVARYFLEQGIPPQRLRASGYADVFPKVPNRDASGRPVPENQAQNRRVVIKLEKVEKDR
jgi:chemotaxis protein MotB